METDSGTRRGGTAPRDDRPHNRVINDARIALITGASRGFGRSMAAHLTAAGVWVIGTYNRSVAEAYEFGEQVAKNGGRLAFLHLDVSRTELFQDFARSVAQVLNDWGVQQFDYLGNNAGIAYFTPYPETPEEQFDELVDVDLKAPYFLTQRLLPLLKDGGRILNLSTALTRRVVPTGSAPGRGEGCVGARFSPAVG